MNRDLSEIRKDFLKYTLSKKDFNSHPVNHFKQWLNEAIHHNEPEPTAMTLSTVSETGRPSGRIVLLKYADEKEGFHFFTNYSSQKGRDLNFCHFASLNFFWPGMERQVRIEGRVYKLTDNENDKYFYSRPEDSRLSASVSPQSQIIENRETLEGWYNEAKETQHEILRPAHWGGYKLIPDAIEFWQGRSGRLHDRIKFLLQNNEWIKVRLAP